MSQTDDGPQADQIVERFLERQRAMYRGGPIEAVQEMLAEKIVWHVPGWSPTAGDHRGRAAVLRYFLRRRALAGGMMRVVKHAELSHGEVLVQLADGEARLDGRQQSWRTAGVYRVEGGTIAEAWLVPLDAAAFETIWTSVRRVSFSYAQRVRPQDCADSTELGHPRLLEFLEAAFVEYWRSRFGPVSESLGEDRQLTLRSIDVEYLARANVDDLVEIDLSVDDVGERSVALHYRASIAQRTIALVRSRYVCQKDGAAESAPWPPAVLEGLQAAPD